MTSIRLIPGNQCLDIGGSPPSPVGVDTLQFDENFMSLNKNAEDNMFVTDDAKIYEENDKGVQTFVLYLIRHGEACHNVLEKAAKKSAKEQAIAEGYDPDSAEVQYREEEARKAVLNDETLFDSPLSDRGHNEAACAADQLKKIINDNNLPPPSEVLVSPLQRTLQTANHLFPDHRNIRVREEIRERCTGKPPDTRASVRVLRRRNTFERFSMDQLSDSDDEITCRSGNWASCSNTEENKSMLRKRTKQLFNVMLESKHRSIAVVTHKGYLRELERGPFRVAGSKEFKNCEVRVYTTSITNQSNLESVDRIV